MKEFKIAVKDGKLHLEKEVFREYISKHSGTGSLYIEFDKEPKTLKQLRYYWGVWLKAFMLHLGYDYHEVD